MSTTTEVQTDFRRALIEYLDGLDPRRVHVSTHGLGIRIAAVRPAVYAPYWQDDELCIEVDLAWWTPDGRLAPAPWRLEHRERIAAALAERNWAVIHSPASAGQGFFNIATWYAGPNGRGRPGADIAEL